MLDRRRGSGIPWTCLWEVFRLQVACGLSGASELPDPASSGYIGSSVPEEVDLRLFAEGKSSPDTPCTVHCLRLREGHEFKAEEGYRKADVLSKRISAGRSRSCLVARRRAGKVEDERKADTLRKETDVLWS